MVHDLEILQDWFLANKLTLNINKSVIVLFGKHGNRKINISIGSEIIPQVRSTKFLGLWIDEDLSWKDHITKLLLKLKRNINLLRTGRNFLTPQALKVLYFAQIHSNLSYGIGIWGSLISKEMLNKLQQVQNTCLKLIDKGAFPPGRKTNRILTVEQQIHLDLCKLWHKKTLGILPINLEATMETDHKNESLTKCHKYYTRQKKLPNRPRSTHHAYHESFLIRGNRLYSLLNQDMWSLKSLGQFNSALKKKLLQDS